MVFFSGMVYSWFSLTKKRAQIPKEWELLDVSDEAVNFYHPNAGLLGPKTRGSVDVEKLPLSYGL